MTPWPPPPQCFIIHLLSRLNLLFARVRRNRWVFEVLLLVALSIHTLIAITVKYQQRWRFSMRSSSPTITSPFPFFPNRFAGPSTLPPFRPRDAPISNLSNPCNRNANIGTYSPALPLITRSLLPTTMQRLSLEIMVARRAPRGSAERLLKLAIAVGRRR